MAEEAEDQEQEGEDDVPEEPKGSRLNQFIILAAVGPLCQSALAYVLVTRFVMPKQRAAAGLSDGEMTETVTEVKREVVAINVQPVYRLKEILVNPHDENVLRYLNTLVTLELENEDVLLELQDKLVGTRMYDVVFRTLGSTSVSEMETSEQRQALKDVIKKRINESDVLTSGEVTGVLFERFILH